MEGLVQQVKTTDTMPTEAEPAPQEVDGMQERAAREPESAEADDLAPEQREAYNSAMQMASQMLHVSDESYEAIMTQLAEGAPEETIPEVISFIIEQIEYTFKGELPEELILPLVDEISDLVIELANEEGILKANEENATTIKGNCVKSIVEDYGATEEQMQGAMQGVTEEELTNIQSMFGGQ